MRAFLLFLMLVLGACSSEPIARVAELAEESAVAEAAADAARVEAAELRSELEAARAGGARTAAELEELAVALADREEEAAAAQARADEVLAELEAARAAAADQIGAAGGAAAAVIPGARAFLPLGGALLLWGAASYGRARAARRVLQEKGKPAATGPPQEAAT